MTKTGRTGRVSSLLPALASGLAIFAAGAALALALLPEWRSGRVPGESFFADRFQEIARQTGLPLGPGEPAVRLRSWDSALEHAYRNLGEEGARWLAASGTGLVVRVSHPARWPGESPRWDLDVNFSLHGRPRMISLGTKSAQSASASRFDVKPYERLAATLRPLLLEPGEALGRSREGAAFVGTIHWRMHEIQGSAPPQHLLTNIVLPARLVVQRLPSRPGELGDDMGSLLQRALVASAAGVPIALAVAGTFFVLLLRARISLVNGALLGLVTLLSCDPAWLTRELPNLEPGFQAKIGWFFGNVPILALSVLLVWSAGESLLRSQGSGFTTSLDALRAGRLGPRGGRALLHGVAAGAALAGLRLGVYALAVLLPGVSPAEASLSVPVFRTDGSPVAAGILTAAGIALALALTVRFLPERWVLPAAALLAGWALSPLALLPYPVELAANTVLAGLLVWVCRRYGLTALLVAAVVSLVLPAALLSGQQLSWMPVTFAICLALPVGIVGLGAVGLSRPERVEADPLPPAFIRRLEEERSFRHEVGLLARMQAGLLPQELPRIEGYDLAARSMLASEAGGDLYDFLRDAAGRLWIAAGDVAGHGYSCVIAQAMIKGGLVSLIAPEESPAGILRQLDRVLRGVATDHGFTSLSLLRLDPATGEALLSNAGYPYPLLFAGGAVTEIELPGLPLGQGPVRTYADRAFHLPPRSALALCSDGLFEVLDRNGNAYGFERAREVLQAIGHRPAVEIVDALLNDCRRHVGGGGLPDDVTVVVVRRG